MASYHTDCHICGRKKWHDAIPGREIGSYCPTCEPPHKRTAHDDVPRKLPTAAQMNTNINIKDDGDRSGQLRTVENKVQLPETATVGAMMVVLDEGAVYCYIDPAVGWMEVGTTDQAAEAIEEPERKIVKAKDKKNNRRAAIEATKRKQAERKRASRSNQTKESKT